MIRTNFDPNKKNWWIIDLWNRRKKKWEYAYFRTKKGVDKFYSKKVEVDTTYDVFKSSMPKYMHT